VNCYKCKTPIPDSSRFCRECGADVSGESQGAVQTLTMDHDLELFKKLQEALGTEFILEKELGRGGMAVVYLGRDTQLGRKVAVKLLPPELTYASSSMVERFKREAQTAAKLDHPNIIPVYRVAPSGKLFWYVMKYLDGEPLNATLEREGQLSVERTVDIVSQVAAALDYAHQNNVVHRDVKPANVVVDKKGWVTVTDFGIAKAMDANTLTASGSIIGTPYYMSPEQCKGKRVGPGADQYSLAVMTYQMLGGHLPFTGDSAVEIVHKHVADPVPPLGVLRPQLPAKVVAVVDRGLAKTPEERFATVAEFARALKAAAEGVDITVAPPSKPVGIRLSKTALVSPVPGALRTAKGTWRDKKALVLGGGVGALVVAAAVGTFLLVGSGHQPVHPSQQPVPAQPPVSPSLVGGNGIDLATRAPLAQTAALPAAPAPATPQPEAKQGPARVKGRDRRHVTPPAIDQGATELAARSQAAKPTSQLPPPVAAAAQPPPSQAQAAAPPTAQPQAAPAAPGKQKVAQPAAQTPAPAQAAPAPAQAAPAPVQAAPAPAAVGFLSLGTQPVSTIYVNGESKGSRVANLAVPAGAVRLRFQVRDSTGIWWAQDREVTVAAGERKVLGYIKLVRP